MVLFRLSQRIVSSAQIAGSVLAVAGLAACAPNLGPMAQMKPASDYAASRALPAPAAVAWPTLDWWAAYKDPQLNALIEEALKDSPDLKAAEARVRQARARTEQAGAALLPSASAKGAVDATAVSLKLKGIPSTVDNYLPSDWQPITQLSTSLNYQLDFFGKNHASVAAAASQARAAQFELASARLEISTGVAAAYAELARLTADRAAAVEAVRVRGDSLTLVADRVLNGLENKGQQAQSSAERAISEGDVAALDQRIDQARHQLAALVGKGPDRGLDITVSTDTVAEPFALPSNLAADLIGRRPDVAAARLRVSAAADRIKVAHADFYPNISLTGSFLDLALTPDQLANHNVLLAQFGPAISLPIFRGGQLEGAYRGARGEYDEAVANYDRTVVQALREVADAVSNQKSLAVQLDYARKASADSERAYSFATLRYKGGLSPYLVVLAAESALVSQHRAVADLQAQTLAANITLVRALGGGFIDNSSNTSSTSKGYSHG
jgi:NodT family efflux transporter outer membrane factor (OMF) lipoprotein